MKICPYGRNRIYCFVSGIGEVVQLFSKTIYFVPKSTRRKKVIVDQMVNIGLLSLPVIVITGGFTGIVLAVQSYYQLHKLTMETMIGALVALSMTRELGPVLVGLMLAGRVGAAIAAEIGTMRVTEQVDALQALATNPVSYLVVPRFLACIVLVPILTVFTDFIGILAGYVISVKTLQINYAYYLSHMVDLVSPSDVLGGLIKAVCFGAIIAIISAYRGLTADGGAQGVGRATTSAVVTSCILILTANLFLTLFFQLVNF